MPRTRPDPDAVQRTSLDLPAGLWREVRMKALSEGTTARAVVVAALYRYVGKTPKKGGA